MQSNTQLRLRLTWVLFTALVLAAGILAVPATLRTVSTSTSRPPAVVAYADPDLEPMGSVAVANISYPWSERLRGWRIEFVRGNDDVAGFTWSQEDRIEIFVRPDSDVASLTRVLAHELGHAVDVSMLDAEDRRQWLNIRRAEDVPWWPTSGAADFETGAGDFAEVFAYWQVGGADYRSRVAEAPTAEELNLLIALASG